MKKILLAVLILFFLFPGPSYSANSYIIVLAEKYPASFNRDLFSEKVIHFVITELKEGDSLAVIGDNEKTLATFDVPNEDGYANSNVKKKKFMKELIELKNAIKNLPVNGEGEAQEFRVPQILTHLATTKFVDRNVTVLLVGSSLYTDKREPAFNMTDGFFPSDGHILVGERNSIYGTAGKEDYLKDFNIHYLVTNKENDFLNELHRQRINRFWGLLIKNQGGNLNSFTTDLDSAFRRFAASVQRPQDDFSFDHTANKVEMLKVNREVVSSADFVPVFMRKDTQLSVYPPAKTVGKLKVGIRWPCINCDVDLYAKSSMSPKFLYYSNVKTDEGIYHKDFQSSPDTVNGLEYIDFTKNVDVNDLDVKLNFYAGHADKGVPGVIRAEFNGSVYEDKFFISATDGNKGDTADPQNWQTIDFKKLLRMN
jgi:hypothetical protein